LWFVGKEPRWTSQHIELKPWRQDGEEIIVLPQRGFGASEISQPQDWVEATVKALKRVTTRPVRVRPHPGNNPPAIPLEQDLKNAWAVVVWASSAGIKALAQGVPVFYLFPKWIGWRGARFGLDHLESPYLGSRERAFHLIGWAQWSVEELSQGLPFRYLLGPVRAAA
jgi:hypothetical protein